ncbi:cation-transporting P-type ATPase [Rapidithrix thailandica]|uniref:Cation-transporting P-type ATPase n=1 Tax=Rapidithrix thailandica TaxID=413964 RepID=A0AAW9S431_9BACT
MEWHSIEEPELLEATESSRKGLSNKEVKVRQRKYGLNLLPEQKPPTLLKIILNQFKSPIIYVLLIAGSVSLIIDEVVDAMFIYGVLILNALIGTVQEWKAEQNAASLQKLLKIFALVKRNGHETTVSAEELVPGDVVLLESGNRVPADIRLIQTNRLEVDESLLTGESMVVIKDTKLLTTATPVSDRHNMAFAGTTIMAGRGLGIVVNTGMNTEVGKIAKAVTTTSSAKPPLIIRMERFARQISAIVLIAVIILGIIALFRGMQIQEVFFFAVALAVSAIPEGLPVSITVALSIATRRMAKRNMIIRKLTVVEALGSVTCIASDKTGTLTVNKQTVKKISLPYQLNFKVTGEGYNGHGSVLSLEDGKPSDREQELLKTLCSMAILCSEGSLYMKNKEWKFNGDAMDLAVLAMGYKLQISPEELKTKSQILANIPYESEYKYAATFFKENTSINIAIKGAFETIVALCEQVQTIQGNEALNLKALKRQNEVLINEGYRVLAVAFGQVEEVYDKEKLQPECVHHLTFLGFLCFIDPLRPEVKEAVQKCLEAGVKVSMVTGDHPVTAFGIAKELDIADSFEQVIIGKKIEQFESSNHPEFLNILQKARVFARVTPLQKLQLVEGLKNAGNFVAVTGDGVNDVPALKKSHIGLAMGSGTDLAKDIASIIIANDNFTTIQTGIEEGRYVYDNIRKVIYLLISTGGAEVVLFILALSFGLPLPLMAVQLLWLNIVTNGIQDKALTFERGEPGTMKKPPRKPTEGIFNEQMVSQVVVSGLTIGLIAFFVWNHLISSGYAEKEARNLLLLLMVFLENVHVFNCRSEKKSAFKIPLSRNYFLIVGVFLAQGIHILSMYTPMMGNVLEVNPISLKEWFTFFGLALILLAVMEIFKWIRSKSPLQKRL